MARMASTRVDVQAVVLASRRVPCICPRQFTDADALGRTTKAATHRGRVVEQVDCRKPGCFRSWTRINAEG